jgi:hypothetical protein
MFCVTQFVFSLRVEDMPQPATNFAKPEKELMTLIKRGTIAISGEVVADDTLEGSSENDSIPSLLANVAKSMPGVGDRPTMGRIRGEIVIRQPEEQPNRSEPVREWVKDACTVVNMVGANSEPSRKGCFDVTDLICVNPQSYCMRSDNQCFAGSVRVPRGIKVTMYNLMADWNNVCGPDKTIVVEESRTARTGDITFWKFGFQDPRRRVCSFKFEMLPGWTCEGGHEKTHRHRAARKRAKERPSEGPTLGSPGSDGDPAVIDQKDSDAEDQLKTSAANKQVSVKKSSDPNYYYNILGDAIYVDPNPPASVVATAEYQEVNTTQPNTVNHSTRIDNESDVRSPATDDKKGDIIPEGHTDRESMLSYHGVHRIMPTTTQVKAERGTSKIEFIQDNQARLTVPQSRTQLVQSHQQLVQAQQKPYQTQTQSAEIQTQTAQSPVQQVQPRKQTVEASLSTPTQAVVDGGSVSVGGGGITSSSEFVSSRKSSFVQRDSSSSVARPKISASL